MDPQKQEQHIATYIYNLNVLLVLFLEDRGIMIFVINQSLSFENMRALILKKKIKLEYFRTK